MAVVHANDGYWSTTGAAYPFKKRHQSIQMVSEDIRIRLGEEDAAVEVLFTFRNHGKATSVTMGFPEEGYAGPPKSILGFKSWVDGRPVKVRRRKLNVGRDLDYEPDDWKAVWLKEVPFSAGQIRQVKVKYTGMYGGDVTGRQSLNYILRTGASWRGPIQNCRVTVDWTRAGLHGRPELSMGGVVPKWRSPSRTSATATIRNLRPQADLTITMIPGFWRFTVNGQPVPSSGWALPHMVRGSKSDPLIHAETVGNVFGRWDAKYHNWNAWEHPIIKKLGGPFEVELSSLVSPTKLLRLARPARMFTSPWEEKKGIEYIYLRDVVKALGGTYTYDPKADLGRIQLPAPKAQVQHQHALGVFLRRAWLPN